MSKAWDGMPRVHREAALRRILGGGGAGASAYADFSWPALRSQRSDIARHVEFTDEYRKAKALVEPTNSPFAMRQRVLKREQGIQTGPKGGQFTLTPGGSKVYLKK